jgi:thioredoxin-dependent peroxiredoxin
MSLPAIGSPAPDFSIETDSGEVFRLSAHRGHIVVLYFYPEDDTEGCTLENIEFTDLLPEFRSIGARVVGISPDTIEKHCSFRDKFNLGVPLGSDPDRRVIDAYGLWQLKKMFGVEFMGVKRATVIIDADGAVRAILHATRIKGHALKVLEAARSLSSPAAQKRRSKAAAS